MSGSAGGNRIPRSAVEKTVKEYIDKVLSKVPGFKSAKVSGSYNTLIGWASYVTTGSYNTILGAAVQLAGTTNNNIVLADGAGNIRARYSGSWTMETALKLTPQSPLPAGSVGTLAVSGSNLYYHNGSSWSQIN
jgi:hypothetical protein